MIALNLKRPRSVCIYADLSIDPLTVFLWVGNAEWPYSPTFAAAFSRNSEPSRMYRRTMFKLRWPV